MGEGRTLTRKKAPLSGDTGLELIISLKPALALS